MLLRGDRAIAAGEVTLAFRRWAAAEAGGTRTAGRLAIESVERVRRGSAGRRRRVRGPDGEGPRCGRGGDVPDRVPLAARPADRAGAPRWRGRPAGSPPARLEARHGLDGRR